MQVVDNTTHTVDVSGVDIDAEVAAAEAREKQFNDEQRTRPVEEQPKAETKARPENVPEEFWDAEKGEVDWTKLNAKLTGEGDDKTKTADEQTPDDLGDEINGHKLTTKHAEDFAPFYEAFEKDGTVPDDAVKYVEDTFGIKVSKGMVEAYMAGQVAKASGQASEVATTIRQDGLAVVGGEQNYDAMSEWALDTLNEAELADYNAAVEGKDPRVAKLAVQALWNRYRAEADIQPKVQLGNGKTTQTTGEGYPNMDAYVRDTMRPEYANDPAYRAKVDAKLARSGSLTLPNY